MATFTLLEMTQEVLSSLQSDTVNSIADNEESLAVAGIIKRKYYDIASRGSLPEHTQMFQLDPSTNPSAPVLMYIPQDVTKMEWLKYFDTSVGSTVSQFGSYSHSLNTDIVSNTKWLTLSSTSNSIGLGSKTFTVQAGLPVVIGQLAIAVHGTTFIMGPVTAYSGTTLTINSTQVAGTGTFTDWVIMSTQGAAVKGYRYVTIVPLNQFLDMVNEFNPSDSNVSSFQFNEGGFNFNLYFKTDAQPRYCTVLENSFVLFDQYDNAQDNTLQSSKTLAYGVKVPEFLLQDNFTPDIDDQQFPLLINEAKALAWFELRQMTHAKAEQEARRQWASVQKDKAVADKPIPFDQFPYFGRK